MIADDLDALDEQQLRRLLRNAQQELSGAKQTIAFKQAVIDKITHENALLKRLKFAAKSEAFSAEQKSLLDETLDTDLAAVAAELLDAPEQPVDIAGVFAEKAAFQHERVGGAGAVPDLAEPDDALVRIDLDEGRGERRADNLGDA